MFKFYQRISKGVFGTAVLSAFVLMASSYAAPLFAGQEVNIYSHRQPKLIAPLVKSFEKDTGIKVNILFSKKGLVERLKTEGKNSPADVLLTTGIGQTDAALEADVVQALNDNKIKSNIPSGFRSKENKWFGLTSRARVFYASKDRVKEEALNYKDLADPKWKGKICIRPGHHTYNIAMIAGMIAHDGEEATKKWLQGFKNNLARKPQGNDRLQVKGVYSGLCDLAIGNTYYMGLMQTNEKSPEQKEWAKSVNIIFPTYEGAGTHVNVSSMMLTKNSPNKANAVKFMEFLSSAKAQEIYAQTNHEYPVKDGVPWSDTVKGWGTFKADNLDLEKLAKLRKRASELVDEVEFNKGPQS